MKPLELSINALARALHVPANHVPGIVNEKRGISATSPGCTGASLIRLFGILDPSLIMVVNEFYPVSVSFIPAEADSILVIHPNAVLPGPFCLESLQPVTKWDSQVIQRLCPMQQPQAPQRNSSDRVPTARCLAAKNGRQSEKILHILRRLNA